MGLAVRPTASMCANCFRGERARVSCPGQCAPDPRWGPHTHSAPPPCPPSTLTVFLLQDQDHICLLQRDLIHLLGQVGLGDLHLEQVWGCGERRVSAAGLAPQGGGGSRVLQPGLGRAHLQTQPTWPGLSGA